MICLLLEGSAEENVRGRLCQKEDLYNWYGICIFVNRNYCRIETRVWRTNEFRCISIRCEFFIPEGQRLCDLLDEKMIQVATLLVTKKWEWCHQRSGHWSENSSPFEKNVNITVNISDNNKVLPHSRWVLTSQFVFDAVEEEDRSSLIWNTNRRK